MSATPTKSNSLREHISKKLDEKFDYSSKSKRGNDVTDFMKGHPQFGKLDDKKDRDRVSKLHNQILKEILKNRNIDARSVGLEKKPFSPKPNQDMLSEITPDPQASDPKQPTLPGQTTTPSTTPTDTSSLTIIPPNQNEHMTEDMVSAFFNACFISIRIAYPELDALTDKEKENLGKMWLPGFKKYLSENWAYVGLPLMATLGMFAPKIAAARKKHKEVEEKKKADIKVQKRTCKYCNQLFPEKELLNHEERCYSKN